MNGPEPGLLLQDFFATEVQLFRADVDLTLRSGSCGLAPTTHTEAGDLPPADTDLLPAASSGLVEELLPRVGPSSL
jgi:hypothetical protein